MYCPFCGRETAENAVFCGSCGKRLESAPSNENKPEALSQENTQSSENVSYYNGSQGGPGYPPYQTKKKFFKKNAVIISAIAIFIALAVIAGLIITSSFSGPVASISKAIVKTFNCDSFDFSAKIYAGGQSFDFDGTIVFNPEERIFELYAEYKDYYGHAASILIKDGISVSDEGDYIDRDDISEALDSIFDTYEDIAYETKKEKINWKKLFKTLHIYNDDIDYELFGEVLNNFLADLNDPDYINEHLGEYKKERKDSGTVYSFDINSKKLSDELTDVFGEVFDIRRQETSISNNFNSLTSSTVVYSSDSYSVPFFGGDDFLMEFTLMSGYLSEFYFDTSDLNVEVTLSKFGDTEIDSEVIDKYSEYLEQSK